LLRAWVEHWDDSLDEPARKQRVARWFGVDAETAKKEGTDEHAGGLIFFDALPIKPVELALDVMTPHYGKWYEQGGEIKNPNQEPEKVPADWHDPIPVPFLVVKQADFLFAIAPRRTSDQAAAKSAMKVLAEALDWLGAGAKTAVGYGRMNHDEAILHQVQTWVQEDQKQREDKQRLQEKLNRKAKLSPLEQAMEDIIDQRQDKNLAPYIALIHAVDAGQWQGDDKRQVAAKIRELMQQNKGQWKEQSGKPNKDREYQRTMKVKGWLE
jgi:CRISPR-associated protein Cmr6